MRMMSNMVFAASIGFTGLVGCGTDNAPQQSESATSAFPRKQGDVALKRDFAISVLSLNGIVGQANSSAESACSYGLSETYLSPSNPEQKEFLNSEFYNNCLKTVRQRLGSRDVTTPVRIAANHVAIDITTPVWWLPIIEEHESGTLKARDAAWDTTDVSKATRKVAFNAYQANESGEAAGLKIAKETVRLLLANRDNIRKAVYKAVGFEFLDAHAKYGVVMDNLERPTAAAELLPEFKDFYMGQLAEIKAQLSVIEKSTR